MKDTCKENGMTENDAEFYLSTSRSMDKVINIYFDRLADFIMHPTPDNFRECRDSRISAFDHLETMECAICSYAKHENDINPLTVEYLTEKLTGYDYE